MLIHFKQIIQSALGYLAIVFTSSIQKLFPDIHANDK